MSEQKRFLLITYPRTASNLLLKLLALETQENVLIAPNGGGPHGGNGYFFIQNQMLKGKMGTHGKNMSEWTEDQKKQLEESTQACFEDMEAYAVAAEQQGKIAFVKEHIHFVTEPTAQEKFLFGDKDLEQKPLTVRFPEAYGCEGSRTVGNDTIFPDEFLQTWKPTILIRHPALVFPSYYRACLDLPQFKSTDSQFDLFMTFAWQRRLHDWYKKTFDENSGGGDISWPVVLDADDIIAEPAVVVKYCEIIGLDPAKLKFEWAPVTEDEKAKIGNPAVERLLSCLLASSGIQKDKVATHIDIDAEAVKWKEEFGEAVGLKLEAWVNNAMEDYEWMKAKRLRA